MATTPTTMMELIPTDDLDRMGSATRHPVVMWRTSVGAEHEIKATSVKFNYFEGTSKFSLTIVGFRVNDGTSSATQCTEVLNLTSRGTWKVGGTKFHGENSSARFVEIDFDYGSAVQPNDIEKLELIVPMTGNSDKGKKLKKVFAWAKLVVDAGIACVAFQKMV